jgi:hypothetical protein
MAVTTKISRMMIKDTANDFPLSGDWPCAARLRVQHKTNREALRIYPNHS